ncbi:MAG: M50 family metallopeptidase [Eubacteriales bacterium]
MVHFKIPTWLLISFCVGIPVGILGAVFNVEQYFESTHGIGFYGVILQLVAVILSIYLSMLLTIPVHELGHLLGGKLSGYRFVFFRLGKLTLIRVPDGSLAFRWYTLEGTGGQCAMVSPDPLGDSPYQLYLLGGSLANIFTGIAALVLSFLFPLFSVPLWLFAASSFFIAAVNLIPSKNPSVPNDGTTLKRCKSDKESRRAFLVQLSMVEQLARGRDLSEHPQDWFYSNVSAPMTSNFLVSHIWLCTAQRMLLNGKVNEALLIFEKLSKTPNLIPMLKYEATLDTIFCLQLLRKFDAIPTVKIDKRMKKYLKATEKTSLSRFRHRYATRILVENKNDGDLILAEFKEFIPSYPFSGEIRSEQRLTEMATKEWKNPTVRPVKLKGYP